jgi:hypothetical protein
LKVIVPVVLGFATLFAALVGLVHGGVRILTWSLTGLFLAWALIAFVMMISPIRSVRAWLRAKKPASGYRQPIPARTLVAGAVSVQQADGQFQFREGHTTPPLRTEGRLPVSIDCPPIRIAYDADGYGAHNWRWETAQLVLVNQGDEHLHFIIFLLVEEPDTESPIQIEASPERACSLSPHQMVTLNLHFLARPSMTNNAAQLDPGQVRELVLLEIDGEDRRRTALFKIH